jgi:hypothetical protein
MAFALNLQNLSRTESEVNLRLRRCYDGGAENALLFDFPRYL